MSDLRRSSSGPRRVRLVVVDLRPHGVDCLERAIDRGLRFTAACDASIAAAEASTFRPDVVIIDRTDAPTVAVASLVTAVRSVSTASVLCLLPEGTRAREALEQGADAALESPYDARDLGAHLRALLRRRDALGPGQVHQVGDLVIDEPSQLALHAGRRLALTKKEFGVLAVLAQEAGRVVSKGQLLERLWGYDAFDQNLVEAHVSGLRRHLPPDARRMVQTVRGTGYVLREEIASRVDGVVPKT